MTPGQRAYEAYRHSPGPTMMPLTARGFEWESLQPDDQAAWEAAVLTGNEYLAIERDTARDALEKILRGLSSGEGAPLDDDEIIAIARKALEPPS